MVWLVQVPFSNNSNLKDVFRKTPLRLDSNVYAIVKESKGLFVDLTLFIIEKEIFFVFFGIYSWYVNHILSENRNYALYDIYKIDEQSNEVETVKYAEWNAVKGLTIFEDNVWKRRANLKGHHLRYNFSALLWHLFGVFKIKLMIC